MANTALLKKVSDYCFSIINSSRCLNLPFHNWQHTLDVVANTISIARDEGLDEETITALQIAAYFHDIGHLKSADNHEELSCEYAINFLALQGYSIRKIKHITTLIKATKITQQPLSIAEKVICDADLAHLGKKNFISKNAKLRDEWAIINNHLYTEAAWLELNIAFLKQHRFYTLSAQKLFSAQKSKNLEQLQQLVAKRQYTRITHTF